MYSFKINDKNYTCPSELSEVTIERFIKFRAVDKSDPYAVLCWGLNEMPVLTMSKQTEKEVAGTLLLIEGIIREIYTFMASDEKLDTPDEITVLGLEVKLKGGLLNSLPYWAFVRAKNAIATVASKDGEFDATDLIPEILAHYLYEVVTRNPYNEHKADEFIQVVNEIPMKEAIQLGNFFLLIQKKQFISRLSLWRMSLKLMSRRLVSKFSISIGILTRWRRFHRETYLNGMRLRD